MQKNRLFVGNLSFDSNGKDVEDYFAQAGSVQEAVIVKDKFTGRPRGFGFVTMDSDADAQKAIEMFHDQEFMGRKLQVNVAQPREARR